MKTALLFIALLSLTQCSTTVITKEDQTRTTPREVITALEKGNARFVSGSPKYRDLRKQQRLTTAGQHPVAAIVSCIDSRTSSELIFDQGLGDIFNTRIAGNIINEDILGSLEFACAMAGTKAIVVVGHTKCGAVAGAIKGAKLEHLTGLLEKIQPSVQKTSKTTHGQSFEDLVAKENVRQGLAQIRKQSATLRGLETKGSIVLVGALYHLDTGRVEWLE